MKRTIVNYVCDICREPIKDESERVGMTIDRFNSPLDEKDICGKCYSKFRKAIKIVYKGE